MGHPFNFRNDFQRNWDDNTAALIAFKHEVAELYRSYKAQYLKADGAKRDDLQNLVKNWKLILTQAKDDWDNLTVNKRNREKSRKSEITFHVGQEHRAVTRDILADVDYKVIVRDVEKDEWA